MAWNGGDDTACVGLGMAEFGVGVDQARTVYARVEGSALPQTYKFSMGYLVDIGLNTNSEYAKFER